MSKKKKIVNNQDGRVAKVVLRNLRVSPLKLSLVVDTIRGLNCSEALDQLSFSRKAIARDVRKALLSAVANAQNNHGMDVDRLYVKICYANKAFVMKRFHARAKGRGSKILKPFSHLHIFVSERILERKEAI